MPPDPITMLDERMSRLEIKLETKLDHLAELLASRAQCPSPGACLTIAPRIDQLEKWCLEYGKRIHNLERWQSSLMALAACVGFVVMPMLVILGPIIRIKLGLP